MKNMEKGAGSNLHNSEWIKLEFLMDPDKTASKYSQNLSSSNMDSQRSGLSAHHVEVLP
jgi:hypothetical protein